MSSNNNNDDQSEASNIPAQSSSGSLVSNAYRSTIERTAQSLHGKERYQYLLDRKTNELKSIQKLKSDQEAIYYTVPATRSQRERRKKLEDELMEIDESIITVEEQIQTLQQRIQSYEQIGHPWPTSGRATALTGSQVHSSTPAMQFSTPAEHTSTPAPRRLFADQFGNRAEVPTELNPKQFIVPANLPTFRHGDNAIQDIDIFIRQFELTLNAHGLHNDKAWSRLLPLCLPFEIHDWLRRTHPSVNSWAQVRTNLCQQYGNPTKRRAAVVKIYTSKQHPDESIIEFMQRFMRLIRQAQAEPDNQDMVDYLLEQLPTDLAIQLESAVQYEKIQRSVLDMKAFARSFPGVHNKRHASGSDKKTNNKPVVSKGLYCATQVTASTLLHNADFRRSREPRSQHKSQPLRLLRLPRRPPSQH